MNTTVLNKHIEWVYICIFGCKSKCQTLGTPSLCHLPAHLASSGPTWARPWWRRRKHCSAPPYSPSPRIEPAGSAGDLGFRGTGPKLPLSILSSREWPNLWQVHTIHGGKSKILSSATFTNNWKWYLEGLESEGAASLKARSFYIYIYIYIYIYFIHLHSINYQ